MPEGAIDPGVDVVDDCAARRRAAADARVTGLYAAVVAARNAALR